MIVLNFILSAAQVTLAWDANPEPVAGYSVHGTIENGSTFVRTNVGNVTEVTIPGLMDAVRYGFVVRAYDAAGEEGEPSNQVFYTATGPEPPGTDFPIFGLALWLKADAGVELGEKGVSRWRDQSGNTHDALQPTNYRQPQVNMGRFRSIVFDGVNDSLEAQAPINGGTGLTVCVVSGNSIYQGPGNAGSERATLFWPSGVAGSTAYLGVFQNFVSLRASDGPDLLHRRPEPIGSGFSITVMAKSGPRMQLFVDGATRLNEGGRAPTVLGAQDTLQLARGFGGNTFWAGELAEILVYARALDAGELAQVQAYLRGRYIESAGTVAAPVATVARQLTWNVTTEGAVIKYTLDGTEPLGSSLSYVMPIEVERGVIVKSKAFRDGMEPSRTVQFLVP